MIKLEGQVAYVDDIPVYSPQLILDFKERIRIIGYDGIAYTVKPRSFSLVRDGATGQGAKQIIEYLREISQYTSDNQEEEAFLKREMEQLNFVHPESVLSRYLNRQEIKQRSSDTENIIFPFQSNLSQKAALENSLKNSISVIDGPPGTGKTETILNIITNLVTIQGKSVAVVSSNNEAVKNIIEKMTKKGYGFLTALLGRGTNQDDFFANMPVAQVRGWNCKETEAELVEKIKDLNTEINQLLVDEREKVKFAQELRAWELEQAHFEAYYSRQDIAQIGKLPLFKATPERILSFLAETSWAKEHNQSKKLMYKLRLLFKYGFFNHEKLDRQELSILLALQKEFYLQQISQLEAQITILECKLRDASLDVRREEHRKYSEKLLRKCIYKSHKKLSTPNFSKKDFKKEFSQFIKRYPIILSTTYALRRSIPKNYLLDYVIIDEASQVDLITGVLAFSCCRNVVVVGDVKQLPQIIDKDIEEQLKTAPPSDEYNYFRHNILSSVIALYGDKLPRQILREHYRCHPQIIEFCNQKYYSGELIPYKGSDSSAHPLIIYKTAEGNHMREVTTGEDKGIYNQRELDTIVQEILENPMLSEDRENTGVVTPYRKQANKAGQILPDGIKSDTVHKYQGREKNLMILSTVLSNSWQGEKGLKFVDNPQMINVAVSRAIKQFVLVTDHDFLFEKGKELGDLIRYMEYSTLDENIIESEVVSVFDLLYQRYSSKLIPLKAKMDPSARYQSEEGIRVLMEEILADSKHNRYTYVRGLLLQNLLNSTELLDSEELKFVNNRGSLDFVVYYKQDKVCALVIEVDGFAFHENNPEQLYRDRLKDSILKKYDIPILRLATNGSAEREKIAKALE